VARHDREPNGEYTARLSVTSLVDHDQSGGSGDLHPVDPITDSDRNLPHLERQWKRIRREALAVLSKNPEDLNQKIHIRL